MACALINAIRSGDTDLTDFTDGEIGEMPVPRLIQNGEKVAKSFAEAWLTDRAAERLHRLGVIPVMAVKNSDMTHIHQACAVAATPAALRVGE